MTLKSTYEELLARVAELEQQQSGETLKGRATDESLREAEHRLSLVADNVPAHVAYVDSSLLYRSVNLAFARLVKRAREDIIGRHPREVLGSAYFEAHRAKIEAALAGQRITFDASYQRDDESLYLTVDYVPNTDAAGTTHGLYILVHDITDRRRAEVALQVSEEKFRALFNNAEAGMFRTRLDGSEILEMNDKYLAIFGMTREEMKGTPSVIRWADPRERAEIVRRLEADGKVHDVECRMLNKQGEVRHCLTSATLDRARGVLDGSILDITERKQAERSLQRYELIVSHSRDIVLFVRLDDGRILEANAAAEKAYGYPRERLLSLSISDLRAPEARPLTADQIAAAATGGLLFETVHQRKDGSVFPVEVSSRGATVDGLQTLISVVRDITERKRADETLAMLRHSIDVHTDGAYWIDPQGTIVYVNNAACRTLGYEPGELLGKTIFDVNPKGPRERWSIAFEALRKDGFYRAESVHRRKDGSEVPVEVLTSYVRFAGKEYACGFARDITERKRMEDALREREYFFRASQQAAAIGSYKTDFIAGLWASSDVLDEIFGIGRDYCRSVQGWLDLVHPDDREMMDKHLREDVIAKRQKFHKEYRVVRHSDRTTRWVLGLGTVEFDPAGSLLSMTGTIQDITERKKAEEERAGLQAQLLQAQKMEAVGQLAGGIAHDFNNILAAITLQVGVLQREPEPTADELNMELDTLVQSVNRAANLTQQLLVFSRRQPMKTGRHDVNKVLRGLKQLLRHLIEERITVTMELWSEPLWIDGDAGMIEQVLLNLCINARDAMPKGGRLTISTRPLVLDADLANLKGRAPSEQFVGVQVSDTGTGMAPEILEHAFEPFFTTKEQGKGTGLGLAIVHGIVTKHGGFVEAASQVGRGTSFTLHLPAAAAGKGSEDPLALKADRGGAERILVVEDDATLRRMTVRCLSNLGYHVTEAGHGAEALAVWEREGGAFDMLFTDMVMPGELSGLDLCFMLRQRSANLKTIIASGYNTEVAEDSSAWATAGATYLPKPYSVAVLAAAIRKSFDGP